MMTPFGKCIRTIRLGRNMILKDMADDLGVGVAFLSGVEHGRLPIPQDWGTRIESLYELTDRERRELHRTISDYQMGEMTDVEKRKKIDGVQAIQRLVTGGAVFDSHGARYEIDREHGTLWYASPFYRSELDRTFNQILLGEWYIPRPYDALEEMRERPGEWVAAYPFGGEWFVVGFDAGSLKVVDKHIKAEGRCSLDEETVSEFNRQHLAKCIPIQDLPKEGQ